MNGFAKLVQGYLIDYWIRKSLKNILLDSEMSDKLEMNQHI